MSHPLPKTYLRIHAPHTHTCTTKNICQDTCTTYTYMHHIHIMHYQIPPENKICLFDLISVLYERPNQNERFLLNNMFFSAFQWNALCISCSWAFHCAFHWNVLHISVKCTVKCAAHFTEMHSEMCSTFHWNAQWFHWNAQWNAQLHEMRYAFHWNAPHFTEKHSTFQQNLMSFWVPTKYRSFNIRKTN